jgi:predicted RNA-binding protein YlxR (DUF448 family)
MDAKGARASCGGGRTACYVIYWVHAGCVVGFGGLRAVLTEMFTSEQMKSDDPALKIQKAADLGRTAWMPNQVSAIGEASNLKKIKGILNKLTPEKFERLLVQMVELVVSAEVRVVATVYCLCSRSCVCVWVWTNLFMLAWAVLPGCV